MKKSDDKSEVITFVWEKLEFINSSGDVEDADPNALFFAYASLMEGDWSELNLGDQDMKERDLGRVDLSQTNLSGGHVQCQPERIIVI